MWAYINSINKFSRKSNNNKVELIHLFLAYAHQSTNNRELNESFSEKYLRISSCWAQWKKYIMINREKWKMKCEPFVMKSIEIWAFHTSKFIIGSINNVAWWLYLTFVFPCFFYQLLLLPASQVSSISLSANTVFHSKATFFIIIYCPSNL